MPFTLAHPGFIYHLKKWKPNLFSMEALVIGSFVPDFDLIFRFTNNRFHLFTFSPLNILLVIFPLSILTWLFYILFLQKPIYYIFDGTPKNNDFLTKKEVMVVGFSLFISILIHLFLDLFAHPNAYFCAITICNYFDIQHFYNLLYYLFLYSPLVVTSLLGFYLLFFQINKSNYLNKEIILNWFRKDKMPFWFAFFISSLSIFLVKLKINGLESGFSVDSIILHGLSGFFYGGIISSFLFGFRKKTSANFESK
jgi:hypothetical protein